MAELQSELNRAAGTTNLDAQLAANVWAGTTNLDLVGALNKKNGTVGLGLNLVCNQLASTTGLEAAAALAAISPVAAVATRSPILDEDRSAISDENGNPIYQE